MGLLRIVIRALIRPARPTRRPRQQPERVTRTVPVPAAAPTPAAAPAPRPTRRTLSGPCYVIDGDTIVIDRIRIRLAGIDAPELDHPWGQKSKWALVRLCKGQVVTAAFHDEVSHDRAVATCTLPDGRDLAAELVKLGLALDWPKFSGGKYRHLEPEGVRKKLWRADARQRGRLPPGA